jgi:Tfp pilus assembly protein PilF
MKQQLDVGEKLFLEGKIDESKKVFQGLLKEDHRNADVSINLGVIYESQGKLLSAEAMYISALDVDEMNVIAMNNLAILYFKNECWDKAELQYKKCIAAQPGDPSLYNSLAITLINLGNLPDARRMLERSVQLSPDREQVAQMLSSLVDINMNTGKLGETGESTERQLNILFVQDAPCVRNYKMAVALRLRGHRVSLAYTKAPLSSVYPGLSDDVYSDAFKLKSLRELWDISSRYDLIHCHNEPDVLTVAAMSGDSPVIHDTHDLISLRASGDEQLSFFEGLANRGASGRVYSTSEQLNAASDMYGVTGPSIVLNNYVSKGDLPRGHKEKLSGRDGEVHLVYEGGIGGNTHRDFIKLFSELAAQNINIHIYPNHYNPELSSIFNHIEKIHYYRPVSPKLIIETMSQYDFGIIPFNLEKGNKEFLNTTIANKLFEYLAAGLPVFASSLMTYEKYFLKNCVGTTFGSAEDIIRKIPWMKEVSRSTDLFKYVKTYEEEIPRLESFYYEIIKNTAPIRSGYLEPFEDKQINRTIKKGSGSKFSENRDGKKAKS